MPHTHPSSILTADRLAPAGDPADALPPPSGLPTGRRGSPAWAWVGACLLAAYAIFLGCHVTVVAGGSDSSGYLNSARLLAAGELQTDLRVPPEIGRPTEVNRYHFSPQGFVQVKGNPRLPPSYPTGFPLHLALAGRLLGWQAGPFLAQLAAAVAAVWLMYRVARDLGVGAPLATAGAVMLGTCPVFLFTSVQTLSDTLATTWTLAALACGVKARASVGWAAAAGAALAMAVLVRPTNLLLAPALLVLVGCEWRRLAAFAAGGLPGALWLGWYNQTLYGGAFRSGYGTIAQSFAWHYGGPTAVHFATWLALLLPAVVLLLPLAAWAHRGTRGRELAALGLAAAGITGIYLFYDVSHDVWWCLRFILPAIAALLLAAVLGAEAVARRLRPARGRAWRVSMALILAGWAAGNSWYWTRNLHVLYVPGYERAYAEAAQLLRERVPENALVVCSAFSGAVYHYTALPTLVYDSVKPEEFASYAARTRAAGRPIYAAVFDLEEEEALRTRCPGPWRHIASVGNIGLWQLP